MRDDQSDEPTVCMESQSDAIERKHERQMARRRERAIAEIQREIQEERNRHHGLAHAEHIRHTNRIAELWKEMSRYDEQLNKGGKADD